MYVHWISTVKGEVTAGEQSAFFGCYNFDCAGGGWYACTGYTYHNFYDMPMGTEVSVSIQYCHQYEWIDVPLQFVDAGNNRYDLKGMNPISGTEWEYMGYVKFIAQTPSGCGNAPLCSGLPEPPSIILDIQQNNFENVDICADINNAAGFQPVFTQQLSTAHPDPCFNDQTQKWQYKFSNEHTVHFNVVIDVCLNNIQFWGFSLIDDFDDFPLNYGCENVMHDMIGHLFYPPRVNLGGYFVKSILIRHELEHKLYFENILYGLKNEFQNDMYLDPKSCFDLPTYLDAYNYFNSIQYQNLLKWWDKAIEIRDNETGLYKTYNEEEEWLKDKIFWAHERSTHLKISKFIFQKINAARNYYCF